jgi:HEAT repeat protein
MFLRRDRPTHRSHFRSPLLLFFLTILLTTLLFTGLVNAKEKPKPKPQPWQISGIEAALDDERSGVKGYALNEFSNYEAQEVAHLVKPDTLQKIGNLLKDEKQASDVRGSAAVALSNFGDAAKAYIPDILNLLKDEKQDSYLRSSAAEALGNFGDAAKAYIPDILNLLKDEKQDSDVRGSAAVALGNFGDAAKAYIPDILNIIKDEKQDFLVRSRAAEALGNFGDAAKAYIPDILSIIKDEKQDPYLRGSVADALGNFGDAAKAYIPDLVNLLKDEKQDPVVRTSAARALSNFGDAAKAYIPNILNIIKDEKQDSRVRSNAADALGNFGDAAKAYIPDILNFIKDETQDSYVRSSAARALSNFGDAAKAYIPDILNIIKDEKQDFNVRSNAVYALGNFGDAAKAYIPDILNIIKDEKQDPNIRVRAAEALGKLGRLSFENSVLILHPAYEDQVDINRWRSYTYFLSGGDEDIKRLLRWVAKPKLLPDPVNHDEGVKTLEVLRKAWDVSKGFPALREDLASKIALVSSKVTWQTGDIILLQSLYDRLKTAGSPNAASVQAAMSSLQVWQWASKVWTTLLLHAIFWIALIFVYPTSPPIQAIFFWNPWVRKILGLGYVSFCLTWIPFLRHRLFEPFQESLLMDARLKDFNPEAYFPDAQVTVANDLLTESGAGMAIGKAIPAIKGQIVLEGKSGLGKSMFLRHLLKPSTKLPDHRRGEAFGKPSRRSTQNPRSNASPPQRIAVYLPATKCAEGVIEAIQKKLHGEEIKDAKFLESLIYSGAIDICIDGLNEASADTRAKITQFVESYFKGNILMTTQPLGQTWKPPANAKTFVMQPLQPDQIEAYLLSRQPFLPEKAPVQGVAYEQACRKFLAESLGGQVDLAIAEREKAQIVLSNPLELSLAALMLASGNPVDLRNLREQQYKYMAEDYRETWNREFPIQAFSDAVYQLWLDEKTRRTLPADDFPNEVVCMADEKFRMAVSRRWEGKEGDRQEWSFRHDKIAEFFIAQTFKDGSEEARSRLAKHIGDSSFSGVYLLLATLLPTDAAYHLREDLIQYAAKTGDHTVSDTYVQIVPCR